jgi:hypothetical protein
MGTREYSALATAEPSQVEYVNLAHRIHSADGVGGPPNSPMTSGLADESLPGSARRRDGQTYERRSMRTSASAGDLGAGGAADPVQGACPYLQKLPPLMRRSVCGTGARQHTARNFASSP